MSGQDLSNFSMFDLFRMEVETQAITLNDGLLALENNVDVVETLASLMRAAHSIKGAARIVQVEAAVQVAYIMEECFVAAQQGQIVLGATQIDVLLEGVDQLLQITQIPALQLEEGFTLPETSRVVLAIAHIANFSVSPPPTKPTSAPGDNKAGENLEITPADHPAPDALETQFVLQPNSTNILDINPEINPEIPLELNLGIIPDPISESMVENALTDIPTPSSQNSPTITLEVLSENISNPGETNTQLSPPNSLGITTPPQDISPLGLKTPQKINNSQPYRYPSPTPDRMIRVSADNLNRLMGLAGETLVEANWLQPFADSLLKLKTQQTDLATLLDQLQASIKNAASESQNLEQLKAAKDKAGECHQFLLDRLTEVELYARRSSNLADRLYREVIASHMAPLGDGVQGFPRMMRDIARQLGKQVQFEIVGKAIEVDRDILERLEAPLTHLLRNAIDHGIETPAERIAVGKPPEGKVRIEATHRAGMLYLTISDDGRGVDLEKLRQKVIKQHLAAPEMAAQLNEAELLEFLFLPGFSTAQQVTEISGRGVGLDVAQSMVQQVGGTLRAVSYPGQGMSFSMQLPLTLSVIRTLLVEIAGEPYAFPLTRIEQVIHLPRTEISLVENRQYFTDKDRHIGLISAAQVLELPPAPETSDTLAVVVVSDNSGERLRQHLSCYGLVVDRFLGERELVVRPLDPRLGKVRDISAAALMDDGSSVLIVDVEDLVRSLTTLLASGQLNQVSHQRDQALTKTIRRILVVDDSITVREMERKILENKGYKVEVAVNGIDGWNAIRTGTYDLIVTDIDMPRMNGIELVSQIKGNPNLKDLPVIIVSYKDREEDRLRGMEVGANYYLTKSSFHDDTLLHAVIDLIGEP